MKTLVALLVWTAVLGGIYFGFGDTPYTVLLTGAYAVAAVILAVFFLLVNGGMRPLPSTEKLRAAKLERERKEEKKSLHPPKHRRSVPEEKEEPDPYPPRPDLFHLGEEGQERAARILLILAAPFFLILVADWIYLRYFLK